MSKFHLKVNYPEVNYDWYTPNTDRTRKCPSGWTINETEERDRYFKNVLGQWIIILGKNESVTAPFKASNTQDLNAVLKINATTYNQTECIMRLNFGTSLNYDKEVVYNEDLQEYEFNIPNQTKCITIENLNDLDLYICVDLDIDITSDLVPINWDISAFRVDFNKSVKKTQNNTLYQSKIKQNYTTYSSDLIVEKAIATQLKKITEIAIENNFAIKMIVDIVEGGEQVSNITAEKTEEYLFTQLLNQIQSGLYNYLTISYAKEKEGM